MIKLTQQTAVQPKNQTTFEQFRQWNLENSANDMIYENNINNASAIFDKLYTSMENGTISQNSAESIYNSVIAQIAQDEETYYAKQGEIGSFYFGQGKNIEDKSVYFDKLFELAQGEIESSDANGNGLIGLSESIKASVKFDAEAFKLSGLNLDDYEQLELEILAQCFGTFDINKDGSLDTVETALPYYIADLFDGEANATFNYDDLSSSLLTFASTDPEDQEFILSAYDILQEGYEN